MTKLAPCSPPQRYTIFGVCEAIAGHFGFNPMFPTPLFFAPYSATSASRSRRRLLVKDGQSETASVAQFVSRPVNLEADEALPIAA